MSYWMIKLKNYDEFIGQIQEKLKVSMYTEYTQCQLTKKLENSTLETVTFLPSYLAKMGNNLSLKIGKNCRNEIIWDHNWIITGMSSHSQNIFSDNGYDFDNWRI